jgi:hypothetical protein
MSNLRPEFSSGAIPGGHHRFRERLEGRGRFVSWRRFVSRPEFSSGTIHARIQSLTDTAALFHVKPDEVSPTGDLLRHHALLRPGG